MKDLEASWARQRREGDAARMLSEDGASPEVGKHYTLSPCFARGDKSWTDDVWKVLALNAAHAVVVPVRKTFPESLVLTISGRAWYPADDLAEAIEAAAKAKEEPKT